MTFSDHDHMEQATHVRFDVRFHRMTPWHVLIAVNQNKVTCEKKVSPIREILVICIL